MMIMMMPLLVIRPTHQRMSLVIIGSFITEIVGNFDLLGIPSGLPALVFLIPSMLVAVTLIV